MTIIKKASTRLYNASDLKPGDTFTCPEGRLWLVPAKREGDPMPYVTMDGTRRASNVTSVRKVLVEMIVYG